MSLLKHVILTASWDMFSAGKKINQKAIPLVRKWLVYGHV